MRVVKPNFHPFNLAMLVAPILFEPLILGSGLLKKQDNKKPKGIDPNKYANIVRENIIIDF